MSTAPMWLRWTGAVLALPVMVLLVIPGAALCAAYAGCLPPAAAGPQRPAFWAALALGAAGLALAGWTCALFFGVGRGTPAPWDPPRAFVVAGPYRHVRNPMMTAVFLMLAAGAWPLWLWLAAVVAANAVYIPLVEEPGLERRFGAAYRRYRRHVPRWLPRATPWRPDGGAPAA